MKKLWNRIVDAIQRYLEKIRENRRILQEQIAEDRRINAKIRAIPVENWRKDIKELGLLNWVLTLTANNPDGKGTFTIIRQNYPEEFGIFDGCYSYLTTVKFNNQIIFQAKDDGVGIEGYLIENWAGDTIAINLFLYIHRGLERHKLTLARQEQNKARTEAAS